MNPSEKGMEQPKAAGVPNNLPFKYEWDQVKTRITEPELKRLHELVDLSTSWTGEDDPNYKEWKELDQKAWPASKERPE